MSDKEVLEKKLVELKEEYSKTKYNKATNKYLGILRAKIAKISKNIVQKKSKKGLGFSVKKTGDATITLVGFPNAGKSSLLKILTGVDSKVAGYAFTTIDTIPGMLQYKGVKMQILDLPGLIEGAHIGRGGGTKVASVIRISDLLLFVIDVNQVSELELLLKELSELNIRVNAERPKIKIERRSSGGIEIDSAHHRVPNREIVVSILNAFGIHNGNITFAQDANEDEIIEAIAENNVYIRAVVALNKTDTIDNFEMVKSEIERKTGLKVVPVSALKGTNIEQLKESLFDSLKLNRIYLKPRDKETDFMKPVVVREGSSVYDVAKKLHSRIAKELKYAYVTGKSVKFRNQKVSAEHVLQDEDIVTLIL